MHTRLFIAFAVILGSSLVITGLLTMRSASDPRPDPLYLRDSRMTDRCVRMTWSGMHADKPRVRAVRCADVPPGALITIPSAPGE